MKNKSLCLLLSFSVFFFKDEAAAQLHMSNADTLYISAGEQLYINGNLELQNGASIINNSAADIYLTGTASIDGEIEYTALANQNVLPFNHRNLRIGGNGNKLLSSSTSVSNYLQLGGSAKLITNNHLLSLSGNSAFIIGSAPFGSNAGSWIVTGNGNAGAGNTGLGGLQIDGIGLTGRTGNVLFPVGPSVFNYNPITVNNTGTTDDFTVAVNDLVVPGADITKSVEATWNITEGVAGGSIVELGAQWGAAQEATNFMRPACSIVHSNGTSIDYHGAVAAADGSDPFTRTGNGFTNFSFFGITSDGIVLPVTFIRLGAYPVQETVQVDWEVAAENGIRYYEVQRSNGNNNFIAIGNVNASGTNSNLVGYQWTDRTPNTGVNFYRIRSIGINGAIKYSAIAKVNFTAMPASITAYPNPVTENKITLDFKNKMPGVYLISIRSTTGALVYQSKLTHNGGSNKYVQALPATLASEMYQMNIDGPGGSRSELKLMIYY